MRAFTILIFAVALVASTFCADAKADLQLSEPGDSATVVRQGAEQMNCCDENIQVCKKLVAEAHNALVIDEPEIEKSFERRCRDLLTEHEGKQRDIICSKVGPWIKTSMEDMSKNRLHPESFCSEQNVCKK